MITFATFALGPVALLLLSSYRAARRRSRLVPVAVEPRKKRHAD